MFSGWPLLHRVINMFFFFFAYQQQHIPLGQQVTLYHQSSHHQETMLPWLHPQADQTLHLQKFSQEDGFTMGGLQFC